MTIQVTAADVSLYHLAAIYLNDATQWWRIAQLNGLSDPDLSQLVTPVMLTIPSLTPALTNGVPELAA